MRLLLAGEVEVARTSTCTRAHSQGSGERQGVRRLGCISLMALVMATRAKKGRQWRVELVHPWRAVGHIEKERV